MTTRLRPRFVTALTLLGFAALAGSLVGCGQRTETMAPPPQVAAVAVTIADVKSQDQPVTLEATGSFEADESSDVAPESSGRVVATPVDVGQFVKEGAVLVRLQGVDAGLRLDEARAAVARAEANLKLAESQNTLAQTTAQRYASLLATGDVSTTVADQARTAAETSVQNVARRVRRWRRPGRSSRSPKRLSPTSPSSRRSPDSSASAACRSASTCSRRLRSSRCSRSTRCGCS